MNFSTHSQWIVHLHSITQQLPKTKVKSLFMSETSPNSFSSKDVILVKGKFNKMTFNFYYPFLLLLYTEINFKMLGDI